MKVKTDQRIRPLRSRPKKLSSKDIRLIIVAYDFFDSVLNEKGKGLTHNYERKKINNNTVVIDRVAGLMWLWSGRIKEVSFEKAEEWIEILNQKECAGYDNWRLPTFEEAMSLLEPKKSYGAHINPIFHSASRCAMTADKVLGKEERRWIIDFFNGQIHCFFKIGGPIRPVRSLQPDKFGKKEKA